MKSSEQSDKASQPTFMQRERGFIALIGFFLIVAGSTYQLPDIARWVGFLLAGYAAIANDSIQTIGTFIASNKSKPWWLLWIFIGGIFLVTMYMSFVSFGGPIDIEMKKVVDEKGAVLKESKDTVLRISLQDSEEKISFREITLDITEGEFAGRESLGFDISKGWSVKTVEIGQSSKNKCFLDGKWRLKPDDISKDDAKRKCWSGKKAPEGASSAPPFAHTYSTGILEKNADGVETWQIKNKGTPDVVGTITINTVFGGDVSNQRLFAKGFDQTPREFSFLQVAAPIFLLILTRLRMPVSTTFLLLTSFSESASSVGKVMLKSFTGYMLAFIIAMAVWMTLSPYFKKWFTGNANPLWRVGQWCTTGLLWSVWLMQDAANIAVYLPRSLTFMEFLGFALPLFIGLGILFKMGGERIQEIVDEKSQVVDVRSATVIDLIYAGILYYFKIKSQIPMSTTWVFLGLIGGREVAMNLRKCGDRTVKSAFVMMLRDTGMAFIGLLVSLLIAMACNDAMYQAVMSSLGM